MLSKKPISLTKPPIDSFLLTKIQQMSEGLRAIASILYFFSPISLKRSSKYSPAVMGS